MACSYKTKKKNDLAEGVLRKFLDEARYRVLESPMEPPADFSPSFVDTTKVVRKPEGTENIPPNLMARRRVESVVTNFYKDLEKIRKNDYKNRVGKVLEAYSMIKEAKKIDKEKTSVKISPTIKEKEIV